MRLSFHDQPSLVEATSSLQFGSDRGHPNSVLGRESYDIDREESRDDGVQQNNDENDIVEVQRE